MNSESFFLFFSTIYITIILKKKLNYNREFTDSYNFFFQTKDNNHNTEKNLNAMKVQPYFHEYTEKYVDKELLLKTNANENENTEKNRNEMKVHRYTPEFTKENTEKNRNAMKVHRYFTKENTEKNRNAMKVHRYFTKENTEKNRNAMKVHRYTPEFTKENTDEMNVHRYFTKGNTLIYHMDIDYNEQSIILSIIDTFADENTKLFKELKPIIYFNSNLDTYDLKHFLSLDNKTNNNYGWIFISNDCSLLKNENINQIYSHQNIEVFTRWKKTFENSKICYSNIIKIIFDNKYYYVIYKNNKIEDYII